MEGIISSMDSFQLMRLLSFTPMLEFPTECCLHMALLFSALAFCFWLWWRKYAQSLFLVSRSSCFPFKFNRSSRQIHVSRVPAVSFTVDQVKTEAKGNESGKRGKHYMRFESSIQNPENEFCQRSDEKEAADCENFVTQFSSSAHEEILESANFRSYGKFDVQSPVIVNCFDVSWRGEVCSGRRVDSNNTVRLWDIPVSRCVNCTKFHETSVIAGAPFWNSPDLNLVSGLGRTEQNSELFVWDRRNFSKPLSFFLGKNSGLDIVEFNDKKVYVSDDLSERMFDLRMGGAGGVEVNRRGERRNGERGPSMQDFGLCSSSVLQQWTQESGTMYM